MIPSPSPSLRAAAADVLAQRIPIHLDRLTWSADQLRAHQTAALRATLAAAIGGSPFHARRLAGIDPSTFEIADLPSLPEMHKREMMASFDDVVTDRSVTRAAAEAALAAATTDPEPLPGGRFAMASGGSSGERGVFVYSLEALADFLLGMVRGSISRLQAMGGPPPGGVPMAIVAAGSAVHATRLLAALFSGDLIRVTSIPATLPIDEITGRLRAEPPWFLQGYPSSLEAVAAEQEAGRLGLRLLGVTGTSESFSVTSKERVAAAFGVAVADQFGSSEGLVGVSEPGDHPIRMASDLAIVELVDHDGRPVLPGTPSARVLVTTLFNPVQPLIRYRLDDRMTAHETDGSGHARLTVEGRNDEPFAWGAVRIHPLAVRSVLVTTPSVREYQVRQTATGIDVTVVIERPQSASDPADATVLGDLAARLTSALRDGGLPDPVVRLDTAAGLERHADTGKVRRFVSLPTTPA